MKREVSVRLCCYCLEFDSGRLRARRERKTDKRQQKASQDKRVACFYVKVLRTHTDTSLPSDISSCLRVLTVRGVYPSSARPPTPLTYLKRILFHNNLSSTGFSRS